MGPLDEILDTLKKAMENHDFIDVGKGTKELLGISQVKLKTALAVLMDEDYEVYTIKYAQVSTGNRAVVKILTKKDKTWVDARKAAAEGNVTTIEEKK